MTKTLKVEMPPEMICEKKAAPLKDLLQKAYEIKFEERPDYEGLCQYFRDMARSPLDNVMDWDVRRK